jgi:hypothetical protein
LGASNTLIELGDELEKTEVIKIGKQIFVECEKLNQLMNEVLASHE